MSQSPIFNVCVLKWRILEAWLLILFVLFAHILLDVFQLVICSQLVLLITRWLFLNFPLSAHDLFKTFFERITARILNRLGQAHPWQYLLSKRKLAILVMAQTWIGSWRRRLRGKQLLLRLTSSECFRQIVLIRLRAIVSTRVYCHSWTHIRLPLLQQVKVLLQDGRNAFFFQLSSVFLQYFGKRQAFLFALFL